MNTNYSVLKKKMELRTQYGFDNTSTVWLIIIIKTLQKLFIKLPYNNNTYNSYSLFYTPYSVYQHNGLANSRIWLIN